jgi:hypothetical protein
MATLINLVSLSMGLHLCCLQSPALFQVWLCLRMSKSLSSILCRFGLQLLNTCVHEKGKAKAVEAEPHGWPTRGRGRPPSTWRVTDLTKSVTPPWTSINNPYRCKPKHMPHFGDSTSNAPILSVVARCSLIGRVVRL